LPAADDGRRLPIARKAGAKSPWFAAPVAANIDLSADTNPQPGLSRDCRVRDKPKVQSNCPQTKEMTSRARSPFLHQISKQSQIPPMASARKPPANWLRSSNSPNPTLRH